MDPRDPQDLIGLHPVGLNGGWCSVAECGLSIKNRDGESTGRTVSLAPRRGGLLSLVCVCLPVSMGRDLLYTAISYGCVGMLVVGIRRHRPDPSRCWWLVAAGVAVWASADVLWALYTWVLHVSPFPSPADLLYLISYVLIACGFGSFVRAAAGTTIGRDSPTPPSSRSAVV